MPAFPAHHYAGRDLLIAAALACCLGGCAAIRVDPGQLVKAGQTDKLAALHRYDGEALRVEGVLKHKDIMKSQTKGFTGGYGFGGVSVVQKTWTYEYPYLVIGAGVFCFFDRGDLDEVAPLQIGKSVVVEGTLFDFALADNKEIVPLLEDCSVECVGSCE